MVDVEILRKQAMCQRTQPQGPEENATWKRGGGEQTHMEPEKWTRLENDFALQTQLFSWYGEEGDTRIL